MAIQVGESLPQGQLGIMTADGPSSVDVSDFMKGKRVALFSVPGAFTPTCSAAHLPGFVEQAATLKEKGIDEIVCFAVNDAFVMKAWADSQGAGDVITMMSDGTAAYSKALGLDVDLSGFGMGIRSQRFSMVVDDGVVSHLFVEAPGAFEVSSADYMVSNI